MAKPHRMALSFFHLATRGPSYMAPKVKFYRFGHFLRDFGSSNESIRGENVPIDCKRLLMHCGLWYLKTFAYCRCRRRAVMGVVLPFLRGVCVGGAKPPALPPTPPSSPGQSQRDPSRGAKPPPYSREATHVLQGAPVILSVVSEKALSTQCLRNIGLQNTYISHIIANHRIFQLTCNLGVCTL